jgi:hypothetical protein
LHSRSLGFGWEKAKFECSTHIPILPELYRIIKCISVLYLAVETRWFYAVRG